MEYLDNNNVACFLTLTYDNDHLPSGGTLVKRDVQLFNKRLRKRLTYRYYFAGEYGDTTHRPHYHAILFGVDVADLKLLHAGYDPLSHGWFGHLSEWPLGGVYVGGCTPQSCEYVAGYVLKKVTGKSSEKYYADRGVIPEFAMMSRRPGIGFEWALKNKGRLLRLGDGRHKMKGNGVCDYQFLDRSIEDKLCPPGSDERIIRDEKKKLVVSRLSGDALDDINVPYYDRAQQIKHDLESKKRSRKL